MKDLAARQAETVWQPRIEFQETEENLILRAILPGIEAKDVDIHVSRQGVVVQGDRRREDKERVRSEFRYGKFMRVIALPVAVKQEDAKAELNDGILTLTLPKANVAGVVKVAIDAVEPAEKQEAPQVEAAVEENETEDVWETQAPAAA